MQKYLVLVITLVHFLSVKSFQVYEDVDEDSQAGNKSENGATLPSLRDINATGPILYPDVMGVKLSDTEKKPEKHKMTEPPTTEKTTKLANLHSVPEDSTTASKSKRINETPKKLKSPKPKKTNYYEQPMALKSSFVPSPEVKIRTSETVQNTNFDDFQPIEYLHNLKPVDYLHNSQPKLPDIFSNKTQDKLYGRKSQAINNDKIVYSEPFAENRHSDSRESNRNQWSLIHEEDNQGDEIPDKPLKFPERNEFPVTFGDADENRFNKDFSPFHKWKTGNGHDFREQSNGNDNKHSKDNRFPSKWEPDKGDALEPETKIMSHGLHKYHTTTSPISAGHPYPFEIVKDQDAVWYNSPSKNFEGDSNEDHGFEQFTSAAPFIPGDPMHASYNPHFPGGKEIAKPDHWKSILHILGAIIPIGLLLSALTPNVMVIDPNATSTIDRAPIFNLFSKQHRSLPTDQTQTQENDLTAILSSLKNGFHSSSQNPACVKRVVCESLQKEDRNHLDKLQNIFMDISKSKIEKNPQEFVTLFNELTETAKQNQCTTYTC